MNIFLDGCKNHIAIQRMLSHWRGRDVLWYEDPSKCDVQLSLIRIKTETALPTVLRLDGIYYDLNTNYIKRNLKICTSHSKADAVIYDCVIHSVEININSVTFITNVRNIIIFNVSIVRIPFYLYAASKCSR